MTSIGSFVKQIPLNNGYFRPQPDLAAALSSIGALGAVAGAASISSYMYTLNSAGTAMGPFTPGNPSTAFLLQAGVCLLKDMGTQFLSSQGAGNSSPIVFRRVQIVDTALNGGLIGSGLATDGVGGIFSSGNDSSYNCAYLLMGFNGAFPAGPFVRTG